MAWYATQLSPPPGFIENRSPTSTVWSKRGWEDTIHSALSSTAAHLPFSVRGGRSHLYQVHFSDQATGVIRRYHRGGFVRYFLKHTYWDRPPRPFAEVVCTELARQRKVSTLEILGAQVEWMLFGFYRGVLISRLAEGFINWSEWLQTQPPQQACQSVVKVVAQEVAQLHVAGIDHADLNMTNVLIRFNEHRPSVLLIDFDRAHVYPGPLTSMQCERNLSRLQRSITKFDPHRQFFSRADRELFWGAYWEHHTCLQQ